MGEKQKTKTTVFHSSGNVFPYAKYFEPWFGTAAAETEWCDSIESEQRFGYLHAPTVSRCVTSDRVLVFHLKGKDAQPHRACLRLLTKRFLSLEDSGSSRRTASFRCVQ